MKKVLFFLFLLTTVVGLAAQEQSVSTNYKKGEFITTVTMPINASQKRMNEVMNMFISQYNTDLNALFSWALPGLKLRGEKDDFIMFNIKSHTYNKAANLVNGVMDIDVAFLGNDFKDVSYETRLVKKAQTQFVEIDYEMIQCEKVINHVDAVFKITPEGENKSLCAFEARVNLDMPYRLMTVKQYKDNIEWRFAKFIANIKREAEKK